MKAKVKTYVKEQISKKSYKILKLSKENLKFSSAHFLIFDTERAERLHGHNYQVQVEFYWFEKDIKNNEFGFFVDFKNLKDILHAELNKWDEYVLLPELCKEMKFKTKGPSLEVFFRDRYYVFPKNEVILLPIVNTSVELLSQFLCESIWKQVKNYKPCGIKVQIEETRGQGAVSSYGQF